MGAQGAGAAEPHQHDGEEGSVGAGRPGGQPRARHCPRPRAAVFPAGQQHGPAVRVRRHLRDLVPQRVDLCLPAAADPGSRRVEHPRGALPAHQSPVLLQRGHPPARGLGGRGHRPARVLVSGADQPAEPGDAALLRARKPNLIWQVRRIRDRGDGAGSLPAVGRLVNEPEYARLVEEHGRERVVEAIRSQIAAERADEADSTDRHALIEARLRVEARPHLRRVINASGVILHTNLGRAPLSKGAIDALAVAAGYSNLELDLETGKRGERAALVEGLLTSLFGAEAAFAVNNNAAAVLLALTALCRGKEVVVSRGQLVEIGGSFRMPDVMRLSGARMVEVGTTNRTRASDFEQAVTPKTAALLRVHTSNFRVTGFTETPSLRGLEAVAHKHGVLLIDDLGSGAVGAIGDEPTVAESVGHCDVVTFSGDKLLGGPQAGIVLGHAEVVKRMAQHPLARAVRIDKLTLAALEATLRQRLAGREVEIPVARMLRTPVEDVRRRAALWSVKLAERGIETELVQGDSAVGGGSLPEHGLATVLLAIKGPASRLVTALRRGEPPVIARVELDLCCLDPRTVLRGEDETLIDAVEVAAAAMRR